MLRLGPDCMELDTNERHLTALGGSDVQVGSPLRPRSAAGGWSGIKLWLDDRRDPPDHSWLWLKTPAAVIELLQEGHVEVVSLDHDLGLHEGEREITGMNVLLWIEEQVATAGFVPPEIRVHSANPPAHERMLKAVDAIERLHEANSARE